MSLRVVSRRAVRGFTLVELMVVVAIIAVAAGLFVRMSSRAPRGDKAAAFARSLVLSAHEARQAALSVGELARLRIDSAKRQVISERFDTTQNKWVTLGGALQAPSGVLLCDVVGSVVI